MEKVGCIGARETDEGSVGELKILSLLCRRRLQVG